MSNLRVEVQFSVFTNNYIKKLIQSKYQFDSSIDCRFYTQGLNDIYIVKTSLSTYYLRLTNFKWRTLKELEAEVTLLKSLAESGLPVSKPVRDKYGCFIQEIAAPEGTRYAVLFNEAKGKYQQNYSLQDCFTIGMSLASIHSESDKLEVLENRFHIDEDHLVNNPLNVIKPYLIHRLNDYNYLVDISKRLLSSINSLLPKDKPYFGVCHGDLHNGNIRVYDGSISIFDFDCFGYGWRAYDLAVFLWNQQLNKRWNKNTDLKEQWESILKGYESVRMLSSNERKAIKIFVVLREIWFIGTQLSCLDMNRGCDWVGDRYFDFHLGFLREWV